MSYTNRFTEVHALLGKIDPDSLQGEQHIGYVNLRDYHRAIVLIEIGDMTGNLIVRIREATTAAGGGAQLIAAKQTAFTAGTDDDTVNVIELRSEELTQDYDWIRVEAITAGGVLDHGVQLFGLITRFAPVSTTAYGTITT